MIYRQRTSTITWFQQFCYLNLHIDLCFLFATWCWYNCILYKYLLIYARESSRPYRLKKVTNSTQWPLLATFPFILTCTRYNSSQDSRNVQNNPTPWSLSARKDPENSSKSLPRSIFVSSCTSQEDYHILFSNCCHPSVSVLFANNVNRVFCKYCKFSTEFSSIEILLYARNPDCSC